MGYGTLDKEVVFVSPCKSRGLPFSPAGVERAAEGAMAKLGASPGASAGLRAGFVQGLSGLASALIRGVYLPARAGSPKCLGRADELASPRAIRASVVTLGTEVADQELPAGANASCIRVINTCCTWTVSSCILGGSLS